VAKEDSDSTVKMIQPPADFRGGGYQPTEEKGFKPQSSTATPKPPQGGTGTVAKPAASSDSKK